MGARDKRVDAYIAKSADFAKPILTHLRATVHEACPEVEETMKWSMPFFLYKGMLCNMASFKQHCAFGFWKGRIIVRNGQATEEAMGQFGRIAAVDSLPPKRVLFEYIKKAMQLNENGVKVKETPVKRGAKELVVPPYFQAALKKNKKALAVFDAFSYSKRKEYVDWLTEAKTDETRTRRLETSLEWIAEGKSRNWKYEKC
jgi:uncharacterized protein YdeI (YjbR/CyaY-like superfamily)